VNDPNHEYIELKNIGGTAFNLNLVKFTDGIDFTFPSMTLPAGGYCVVVRNQAKFTTKYPSVPGGKIAGEFVGALNNAGERIELQDALGQTILNFRFKDGWYPITGLLAEHHQPDEPRPEQLGVQRVLAAQQRQRRYARR